MRLFEALAENYLNAIMPGIIRVTFKTGATPIIYGRVRGTAENPGTDWTPIDLRKGDTIDLIPGTAAVFRTETGEYLNVNGQVSPTGNELASITFGGTTQFWLRRRPFNGKLGGLDVKITIIKTDKNF